MTDTFKTDIAIIGGGISGLWLLNAFRQLGFKSVLLEKGELGSMQTIASQGMIHGGIKYALSGFTTPASEGIATMPEAWRSCLSGSGPIDLRSVNILSNDYYLFSDGSLSSKMTTFLGSKAIRSRISKVDREQFPAPFSNRQFSGWLYRLQDLVVETSSLLTNLQKLAGMLTYQCDAQIVCKKPGQVHCLSLGDGLNLEARLYVLAAGAGNARLLHASGNDTISMQQRPLHQVMVSSENLPAVFAHAVGLASADKPRVTITTHHARNGRPVWYIGGNLAETGVDRSEGEQIDQARREMASLFPWIDFVNAKWATHRVDRAEPASQEHTRPDHPYYRLQQNLLVCWPTKLTLIPAMAKEICAELPQWISPAVSNQREDLDLLEGLPIAEVSAAPWETAF